MNKIPLSPLLTHHSFHLNLTAIVDNDLKGNILEFLLLQETELENKLATLRLTIKRLRDQPNQGLPPAEPKVRRPKGQNEALIVGALSTNNTELGLSVSELEKETGIGYSAIHKVLTGKPDKFEQTNLKTWKLKPDQLF